MTKFNEYYESRMSAMLSEKFGPSDGREVNKDGTLKNPVNPATHNRGIDAWGNTYENPRVFPIQKRGKGIPHDQQARHADEIAADRSWGQNFGHGLKDFAGQQVKNVKHVGKGIRDVVTNPKESLPKIGNAIKNAPQAIGNMAETGINLVGQELGDILKTGLTTAGNVVGGTGETVAGAVTGDKERAQDGFNQAVINPARGVGHAVKNKAEQIAGRVNQLGQSVKGTVDRLADGRIAGKNTINFTDDAGPANDFVSHVTDIPGNVKNVAKEFNPSSYENIEAGLNAMKYSNALQGAQKAYRDKQRSQVAGPSGQKGAPGPTSKDPRPLLPPTRPK